MNFTGLLERAVLVAVVLFAAPPMAQSSPAEPADSIDSSPHLDLLFELELAAEDEILPYIEAEESIDHTFSMSRDLVAQGEGRVTGRLLAGEFRWSLLGRKYPGNPFGRLHLTGWLETEDGAEMFFRATGYAHDEDTRISTVTVFSLTGGFEVELEPQYEWLNGIVVLIEGRFDPDTKTFNYRAWVPSEVLARRAPTQ